jgi:hypothetical protein
MSPRLFGDSTTAADIPGWVAGVGGYVNGRGPWSPADWARFGKRPQIRYNVTGDPTRGNALDVETGDATPAMAPAWWDHRHVAGVPQLAVYCNRSTLPEVLAAMGGRQFFLILATLDGSIPAEYEGRRVDAVQFAGAQLTGGHWDATLVWNDAWLPSPPAGPDAALLASAANLTASIQADAARLGHVINAL